MFLKVIIRKFYKSGFLYQTTMKFHFSEQSGLYERVVYQDIDRFSYVQCSSEKKIKEYIFGYKTKVPDENSEPDLYRGARVSRESPDETILSFDGLDEIIILITLAADDRFRVDSADIVSENELFRIE
jgi:hypothetical protein